VKLQLTSQSGGGKLRVAGAIDQHAKVTVQSSVPGSTRR
jgi:hypothetical protein